MLEGKVKQYQCKRLDSDRPIGAQYCGKIGGDRSWGSRGAIAFSYSSGS
jgi:hypothetical protein